MSLSKELQGLAVFQDNKPNQVKILSLFSDKITEHTIPQVREATSSLNGLPKMHEQFSYLVFRFPLSCLPAVPCPT